MGCWMGGFPYVCCIPYCCGGKDPVGGYCCAVYGAGRLGVEPYAGGADAYGCWRGGAYCCVGGPPAMLNWVCGAGAL